MLEFSQLEAVTRRDPAKRGLASLRDECGSALLSGALESAARELAQHGRRVLIVTGFAIVTPDGVAAETDGPPGAIYLAAMLRAAEIDAVPASDCYGASLLRA